MNITIFTICTGKYDIFFEDFYNSCEKYFLPNHNKKYFVFTDKEIINRENIIKVNQEKLGWPYDTMMRFQMFNRVEQYVLDSDYTFFFNVNLKFVGEIGEECLPKQENDYLVGVRHQGFYSQSPTEFPYERNFDSNFYIPIGEGKFYFQGCFIGGVTSEFMKMSKELEILINRDLGNDIVPIWHDESAMNWYYSKRNVLSLNPNYACPEIVQMNDLRAIQLDKNKLGGHNFLRN